MERVLSFFQLDASTSDVLPPPPPSPPPPPLDLKRTPSQSSVASLSINISRQTSYKRVQFATSCSVVLIPTRHEYFQANIQLWYDRYDQARAQQEVSHEVKYVLYTTPSLSIRDAMEFLYQPHTKHEKCMSPLNISFNSISLSDVKERLNILFIRPEQFAEQVDRIYEHMREELYIYNRFVCDAVSVCVCEEGIQTLHTHNHKVDMFDVICIHHHTLLHTPSHNLCAFFDTVASVYRGMVGMEVVIGCIYTGDGASAQENSNCNAGPVDLQSNIQLLIHAEEELRKEQGGWKEGEHRDINTPSSPRKSRARSNSVSVEEESASSSGSSATDIAAGDGAHGLVSKGDRTLLYKVAEYVREYNMHFLWREEGGGLAGDATARGVKEEVHMLPILMDKLRKSNNSAGCNGKKEGDGGDVGYFKKTRSPPQYASPQKPAYRKAYAGDK